MDRQKFNLISKKIHCKVMLNEIISASLLNDISDNTEPDHQTVIFSFTELSTNVKNILNSNYRIQVIGEEGIKDWVSITNCVPSRIGSISKIRFNQSGKYIGKFVKIESINYETGLASILILPELINEQIHVGALEEIRMNIGNQSYYEQVYDNYLKFLLLLSKYSLAEFQNGLEIIPD